MKKRLFVAITLPGKVGEQLQEIQQKFTGENIRLSKRENFHITVLFLGAVEQNHIPMIKGSLEKIARDTKQFTLKTEKLILAPPKLTRMVWVICEKSENYDNLVKNIFAKVKGFTSQKLRTQRIPHITLALFKVGTEINTVNWTLPEEREIPVTEIHLFESKPTKGFSNYKLIDSYKLS